MVAQQHWLGMPMSSLMNSGRKCNTQDHSRPPPTTPASRRKINSNTCLMYTLADECTKGMAKLTDRMIYCCIQVCEECRNYSTGHWFTTPSHLFWFQRKAPDMIARSTKRAKVMPDYTIQSYDFAGYSRFSQLKYIFVRCLTPVQQTSHTVLFIAKDQFCRTMIWFRSTAVTRALVRTLTSVRMR